MAATDQGRDRPRLQQRYDDEVREQLKDDLELGNIMEVPRLDKIVLNWAWARPPSRSR